MANISIWPSQPLDGDQWERNTWGIGTPITKEKLENLEEGIAVLATQMEALLREIEIDPSTIILNGTRLDTIQKWITAAEDGNYDFTKGSIAARLNSIDTLNSTQNNRLDSIENVNSTQSADISSLKTRATNLENRATSIEALNTTQNERLDSVESKNIEQDSRLDDIDTVNTNQNTEITSLKTRATSIESVNTTQNTEITNLKTRTADIENVNTTQNNRLTALENELSGSGTGTSGSSRIDNLQTWIAGSSTSTYSGATIASRLGEIDTLNSSQNTRLNSLETDNTTNKTDITNIINEIGGTYSTNGGFTNSQISKISSIIEKNDTQDSNINKIKLEIWGENKDYSDISRIDELGERTSTVESLSSSNQSRISSAESRITRIEDGAVAAKILNYTTTNNADSDSLILPTDSIIDKNSIAMIFLNVNTLGLNDITIQDGTTMYNVKVNNNTNLRAHFSTGSLLGLYRGDTNDIYMFNAPLAI